MHVKVKPHRNMNVKLHFYVRGDSTCGGVDYLVRWQHGGVLLSFMALYTHKSSIKSQCEDMLPERHRTSCRGETTERLLLETEDEMADHQETVVNLLDPLCSDVSLSSCQLNRLNTCWQLLDPDYRCVQEVLDQIPVLTRSGPKPARWNFVKLIWLRQNVYPASALDQKRIRTPLL